MKCLYSFIHCYYPKYTTRVYYWYYIGWKAITTTTTTHRSHASNDNNILYRIPFVIRSTQYQIILFGQPACRLVQHYQFPIVYMANVMTVVDATRCVLLFWLHTYSVCIHLSIRRIPAASKRSIGLRHAQIYGKSNAVQYEWKLACKSK